ncbi:MAG TPA: ABC transporter permease [Clostridia bacterium]|nr:ABC transporter permease [Clostridia bacterium]
MTYKQRLQRTLQALYYPLMAIIASLFVGSIVVLLTSSTNPFTAYGHMLKGGFGTLRSFDATMTTAIPLMFTALSFSIARRSGIINLGAEGQFIIGALCASAVGIGMPNIPAAVHLPLTLIAGFLGGAAYGFITGVLKVRFGASELIITIMLNYIARLFNAYLVTGPMLENKPPYYPQSAMVAKSAMLGSFIPGLNVHTGILFALVCVFLYHFYLWKTTSGFRMRVVGLNPTAGEYAGMSVRRSTLLALFLAGGLAGLGGCIEIIAVQKRLMITSFSVPYGFTGIAVALLGNMNPVGIIFSGILFGGLSAGSLRMEVLTRDVNANVAVVIQALIILFVVGRQMFQFKRRRKSIVRPDNPIEDSGSFESGDNDVPEIAGPKEKAGEQE